jgi:protein TonB
VRPDVGPDQPVAVAPLPALPRRAKADEDAAIRRFAREISRALGKEMSEQDYPRLARDRGWQGTAELRLQIGTDGKLKNVSVLNSSGYEVLDQRAIEKVNGLRMPRVPSEIRARAFTVRIPIKFALRDKDR